jgi:hypothetical protein
VSSTGDPATRKVVAATRCLRWCFRASRRATSTSPACRRTSTAENGLDYQYYAGEVYFLYGQFELARARFEPMWKEHCGKDEYGYRRGRSSSR